MTAARAHVARFHKRLAIYCGSVALSALPFVAVSAAQLTSAPAFLATVGLVFAVMIGGGLAVMDPEYEPQKRVLREWDRLGIADELSRFERTATSDVAEDPRMEAATQIAERIRALGGTSDHTQAIVAGLGQRLGQLIADYGAATAAVVALRAAGAGSAATERLATAAHHLDAEASRILGGLSDLYAALLETESGASADATAGLGELMAWLGAEAELARATQTAEAMRPAAGRRPVKEAATE